jgi:D-lactate dehydrogenase
VQATAQDLPGTGVVVVHYKYMKIVYLYNEAWEQEYITTRVGTHEILYYPGTLQEHPTLSDETATVLSVFITSTIGPQEMDRFPNLQAIVTRSTGFDHIDLAEAKKRGIVVSNVPTYGEHTVAEYAFAILLTLSRRTYESYDRVIRGGNFSPEGLRGFDLLGKKMGIVGTGNIGQHAIRMARGFGMDVIAFDVHEDPALAHRLGFMYVTFADLLAQSDVISLHAPYNLHTRHMINMTNVRSIKQGAYLINTARGGLVETRALVTALEEGILAGAGLDVLEEEGYMADDRELLTAEHPNVAQLQIVLANQYLIDHPRVLVMPHNAFNTQEAIERILTTTVQNIQAVAQGTPVNTVH